MPTTPSIRDRLQYRMDNFMSRGGLSIFLALLTLFVVAFAAMGVVRIVAHAVLPDETLAATGDQLWRTFLQITDAGAVAEDGDSAWLNKVLGIATIFIGLVLFSSLVAFITAEFDAKLADLRKGRSAVLESGHTLIIGTGERAVEIIRELIVANESESRGVVAVLADAPKDELDDFFAERIEERKTTEIITRSGPTSSLLALRKMGVERARSVIVLSSAQAAASPEERALADARVLKTIMAVVAATGETSTVPVVCEFHGDTNRELALKIAPGRVTTLDERSILAKLLVQTSRTSGLAVVYSNLVGFVGNEIYFFRPDGGWGGRSFGQIQFHFPQSVPIGFRTAHGEILLNPEPGYVPADTAEGIVLAEDDSTIGFQPQPVVQVAAASPTGRRAQVGPERQLLVGWSEKGRIIVEEYAKYLQPGSAIDVLLDQADEEKQREFDAIEEEYPGIEMRMLEADIRNRSTLEELRPESYNNVILLAGEGDNAEEIDTGTIATLLWFRQYFREMEASSGRRVETQLITEIMDSDNVELVLQTGVKDFLISNQFVSKVFAQVSQEPEVMSVYDDLFRPEGSEIYVKAAGLYFENLPRAVTFAEIMAAAQARNEVAFGVKLAAFESDPDRNYGVSIIPAKSEKFMLSSQDAVVVLAEDET